MEPDTIRKTLSILGSDMKTVWKRIIEVILFIFLLACAFSKASLLVVSFGKGLDNDRNGRLFYELPADSLDIMFAGDSHVFHSFIPQMIFEETGATSAVMASSSQSIINTYWGIKETLKKQDLKFVVIDAHSIECTLRRGGSFLHFVSGALILPDLSLNKIRCYRDLKNSGYGMANELKYEDVVGFLQYRQDYERTSMSLPELANLLIDPKKEFKTFGYYAVSDITPVEKLTPGERYDDVAFEETISYEYLLKIIDLCKENGIQLIITKVPFSSSSGNLNTYDAIFKIAKERSVDVIDFYDHLDEIKLDLSIDYYDESHVNYGGAKKITSFLIDYLKENYTLEDHRGDRKYDLWNQNKYDYNILDMQIKENTERDTK